MRITKQEQLIMNTGINIKSKRRIINNRFITSLKPFKNLNPILIKEFRNKLWIYLKKK